MIKNISFFLYVFLKIIHNTYLSQMLNELIDHQISNKLISLRQKKCSNNHVVDKLCVAVNCTKHTAHCSHPECGLFQKHIYCPKIQIKAFSKLIQEEANINKQFILGLHDIEKEKLQQLKQSWVQFIRQEDFYYIVAQDRAVFERIFTQDRKRVKGSEAEKLFSSWIAKKDKKQRLMPILLKSFSEQLEKITQSINNLRHRLYKEYLNTSFTQSGSVNEKTEHTAKSMPNKDYTPEYYDLDSRVLDKNDKEYNQKIAFLCQTLGKPKGFKLIYRGSELNFSSAQFHKLCDDIPHTLTIVKTGFGKTIAGYTPLPWKSSPETEYFTDKTMKSCLFQVDSRHRLILTDKDTAIGCNSRTGPLFGSGHDLAIYDRCNANNYSYANYPRSYACDPSGNRPQILSFQAFSGARKSSNFTVEEYEVFKVVFEDG